MQQLFPGTIEIPGPNREAYVTAQLEVELGARCLSSGNAEAAVTMFRSALHKIDVGLPFHDELTHNLLVSYKMLIEQKLATADTPAAERVLEHVLKMDLSGQTVRDHSFLAQFASLVDAMGLLFSRRGNSKAFVQCTRKALSIKRSPGFQVNLENALRSSKQRAVLSDYTDEITPEQLGRHLFIACVPKSGSTFLKNVLLSLTGYGDAFIAFTPGQFEQDLYLPGVINVARSDTVTQLHSRASDANVQMMQAFEIKPVVLVRNIFDAVVSLLDFYDGGAFSNTFFRADYKSLDDQTRIDLLIDNLVPWYFQFVASWSLAEKQGRLEIFWLSYEELINDKPGSITSVLKFYGLGAPLRGIEQRVKETESKKGRTRFNKGLVGRGDARLSEDQKARICSYARYFPSTDFSKVGL